MTQKSGAFQPSQAPRNPYTRELRLDFLTIGHRVNHPLVFGADFYVPLNDWVFLFGEANFITPNDSGTVTATLGVAITWGGARNVARNRFAPLLPVANNPSFAVNLRP